MTPLHKAWNRLNERLERATGLDYPTFAKGASPKGNAL